MKHSESKSDRCYCVKCALVVRRLLKALKEITKHPENTGPKSEMNRVCTKPEKLFTQFQEFKANLVNLHPSLTLSFHFFLSLFLSLFFLTHIN